MAADGRFDPQGAVTFDLPFGQVHLDGAPNRVMVPAAELAELCRAAGAEAIALFGQALGEAMGRRLRARLGADGAGASEKQRAVRAATFERVIEHLAGELALVGLGALRAERWGRALVLLVEHCPLPAAHRDRLLERVLAAALEAAAGKPAGAVCLGHGDEPARFVVVGAAGAEEARALVAAGRSCSEVLAALNERGSPA